MNVQKVEYLCFAEVLDAPIQIQQLCLHCFNNRFDFRSTLQLTHLVGPVQFIGQSLVESKIWSNVLFSITFLPDIMGYNELESF
jgi:hypothetical protein